MTNMTPCSIPTFKTSNPSVLPKMAAVVEMVNAKWRQRRLLNIEAEMFQRQMVKPKKRDRSSLRIVQ
jgi:hypothetical protein